MNQNPDFNKAYEMLNNEQKQAVDSIYGPIMVVAGPGTGKTQIIATRTANIIKQTGTHPSNIFITTFTDAGVIAIRKRLVRFLGNEGYKVNVSTIHSFAQDVIKTFPEKFIEQKAANAIDGVDSLELLKQIIDEAVENKKISQLISDYDRYYYLRTIQSKIGTLKQEGVSYTHFEQAIQKQVIEYEEELSEIKPTLKKYESTQKKQATHIEKLHELLYLFTEYNNKLRQTERYDFNDMINFVLEALQKDGDILDHYKEQFQFIMLDEYQDTNNAQNQIIDLLLQGEEQKNIMVVGDDDQSIYRFQGANIENMLEFSTKYPETKFIVLKNNYRSSQPILDTADMLIQNNTERLSNKIETIQKELIASGKEKNTTTKPQLFQAASEIEEQAFILQNIQKLLSENIFPEHIAIIVRNNREVQDWSLFLEQNGISVSSKLNTNILQNKYVQYILGLLQLIDDPFCSESLLIDTMRAEISGLSSIDIFKINRILYQKNYSKKWKVTFLEFLDELKNEMTSPLTPLLGEERENLENLTGLLEFKQKLIDYKTKSAEVGIQTFFSEFIKQENILKFVETHGNFDDIQDIYTLFNSIKKWGEANKNLKISDIISKIELHKTYNYPIARQNLKAQKHGVQVLTAHSSKGLEYDSVFIPGLYTGNWDSKKTRDLLKLPSYISGEGIQQVENSDEEDRRLFFVAITRAERNLYVSYPAGMGTKPLLEGVFLQEIKEKLDVCSEFQPESESQTIQELVKNNIENNLIEYSGQEIEYIREFLENYKLSASDLNAFLEDPMIFLNRVVFKYPFEDNKYTIFGKVYHRTLELFYLKFKKEEQLPEKSYLAGTFRLLLEKEAITPEEYENMMEKGIAGLEGYYDLHSGQTEVPLVLEYSFRRKNIVFDDIPLTGTIDKIEKSKSQESSGVGGELPIGGQAALFRERVDLIDYKTGKAKTLGIIKGLDRFGNKKDTPGAGNYFRQLLFYKLLCEMDYDFGSSFEVGNLALDFVEGKDGVYKYVEVEYNEEEYEDFKNELKEAWEKITDMEFWKGILESQK